MSKTFKFPPAEPQVKLRDILDAPLQGPRRALPQARTGRRALRKATLKWKKRGVDVNKSWVAVDVMSSPSRSSSMRKCLPCLTASRAAAGGHWITCLHRMLRPAELLRAQGFDPEVVRWRGILTERQLGAAVGNSMTQTTMAALLERLLPSVGLL
jgi:site-specific DNA-cytosine methylase